ncbi:hypothetical protein SLEP1_g11590 [Rubroshorea leprosula]|nr:hypothetical protein SLEP1_g11590 [Rubroshorea leprosula]
MADAIVSLILEELKTTIIDRGKEEVKLLLGLEEEVEKLERNLDLIHGVLAHAEEKKRTDVLVKKWLDRLKEAGYDMEDALDEWRTAVEMELRGGENQRKVLLCNFVSCFSFHQLSTRRQIALNIKEINQRLDEIVKEKDRYQLISKEIELPKKPESSSFVDVSRLCGRDGVKRDILSCLWGRNGEEEASELIQTISIVGMGGLGKTALAQLIYNDCGVQGHFDDVIWVCVSDLFDEKKVARAIIQGLEKLGDGAAYGLESNPLQFLLGRISNSIRGMKYFLVLDDVWDGNKGERWEGLKTTFKLGAPGSRILVTTRDVDVAKMMGSSLSQIIHLEKLGEKECWLILRDIAFRDRDEESCQSLEAIGRKIANRCKGLPLAAKTLGSLLKSKRTKQEWQSVLNSDIWKLDLAQKDIFAPLLLSYYDLPPPVRRCFLYCVVFPKDFVIRIHFIVSNWMAQGYLGSDGNADLESVGIGYFHILVSRSFFQDFRVWDGDIVSVKMHDVVHDFVRYLAENEFVIKEVESDNLNIDSAKHRHLTVMVVDALMPFPTSISGVEKLRTLHTFTGRDALTCEALRSLFNQCRCLRLLDLGWSGGLDYSCKEIPKEIGKLIHLRFLSLAYHGYLEGLPEALSNMYNLESLCLNGCINLKQLPDWISKLFNLRLLNTIGCLALTHYPKDIWKLTSLRALLGLIARADRNDAEEFSLADLGNLKHLHRVWLKVVGDSIDKEEARKAELENIQEYRQAFQPKFPLVPVVGVVQLCKPYFYCLPAPPNEPKSKRSLNPISTTALPPRPSASQPPPIMQVALLTPRTTALVLIQPLSPCHVSHNRGRLPSHPSYLRVNAQVQASVTADPSPPPTSATYKLNKYSSRITEPKSQGGSQAILHGVGLSEEDMSKPQVGISSVWYEGNTCNMHLLRLSEAVKQGVEEAGMVGFRFNTIGVYGEYVSGSISDEQRKNVVLNSCPGAGACGGMYTANTMASAIEAMGMSLPYSSSIPAEDQLKLDECRLAGKYLLELLKMDLKPRDIITRKSLHNAMVIVMALGGSTNAVLHLIAIARSVGLDLTLDDFQKVSDEVPFLADLKPSGKYVMEDVHKV